MTKKLRTENIDSAYEKAPADIKEHLPLTGIHSVDHDDVYLESERAKLDAEFEAENQMLEDAKGVHPDDIDNLLA